MCNVNCYKCVYLVLVLVVYKILFGYSIQQFLVFFLLQKRHRLFLSRHTGTMRNIFVVVEQRRTSLYIEQEDNPSRAVDTR